MADQRLADAEVIVSGGDLVMGPFPAECLDLLEADGRVRFLSGNGDREVYELEQEGDLGEAARWCNERLGPERLDRVERLALDGRARGPGPRRCALLPRDADLRPADPDRGDAREGRGPGDRRRHGRSWSSAATPTSSTTGASVGRGSSTPAASGCRTRAPRTRAGPLLGADGVELLSTPYDAVAALDASRRTGFPLVEQWLAPVLRGHGHGGGGDRVVRAPAPWRVATSGRRGAAGSGRGASGSARSSSASPASTRMRRSHSGSRATSSC